MAHIIVSFLAALTMAAIIYIQTSSLALAFLAYTGAGILVFLTGLIASALAVSSETNLTVARS